MARRIDDDSGTSGYDLYQLLAEGAEKTVEYLGTRYQMKLCGTPYGSNNWLRVKGPDGQSKKWGWGWDSEVCFRCLTDLRDGWENTEGNYSRYGAKGKTED
jgi:hypothetical protein